MTHLIRSFFGPKAPKSDEFSEFFAKSSGDRVKVMREILREANAQQKRVVEDYSKA